MKKMKQKKKNELIVFRKENERDLLRKKEKV